MFRRREKRPELLVANHAWPEPSRKHQSVHIEVKHVLYRIEGSPGRWSLAVEGFSRVRHLSQLLIAVVFDRLEPFETARRLSHSWQELTERVEGTAIYRAVDPLLQELHQDRCRLNVTLFHESKTGPAILQAFNFPAALADTLLIDIQLDFPGEMPGDFWIDSWRTKELRVRS
jgi:hypothetical protein